jgi:hypothetical protein
MLDHEIRDVMNRVHKPVFEIHSHVRVTQDGAGIHYDLHVWLFNKGGATANNVVVDFVGATPDTPFSSDWAPNTSPNVGKRRIALKHPLHPSDHRFIASWMLGAAGLQPKDMMHIGSGKRFDTQIHDPTYQGGDFDISLRLFAQDQPPITLSARFAKEEIQALARKQFLPSVN